jgi:hypothetical protein
MSLGTYHKFKQLHVHHQPLAVHVKGVLLSKKQFCMLHLHSWWMEVSRAPSESVAGTCQQVPSDISINIVALEQENTGYVSQLASFVVSGQFTDLERYCAVKQQMAAPMNEGAGVQAGATGVSFFFLW